jgi:hypothetical protein
MRFMNVAPARAWAGLIFGRTNLGLGVQGLSDAFQSWIRGVEGESVGSVEHLSPVQVPEVVICRCLQRAKSIKLSLLAVSDINRITQGYGLPGRKTGDLFRSENVISTQQTLSRD